MFILLLFGILEFALINASIGAFHFASQDAARQAAISGPTDPSIDADILANQIRPHTSGVVAAKLISIDVFKANEAGDCSDGTTNFPCPLEDSYSAATHQWTVGWPYASRSDQLITGDYLGVRITYVYTYLTAFFATTSPQLTLTALSIQRIEPQEYSHHQTPDHSAGGVLAQAASRVASLLGLASPTVGAVGWVVEMVAWERGGSPCATP